ncbi:MAG: aromatic amino acid lyase, partial [Candidatus Acidiferrales bacterium]
PYPGQTVTARNLTQLNRGSEIRESHRAPEKDPRVQDAYSLRCTPQVHGAVRDALSQVRTTLSIELNSATDNPLVFAESGEVVSGGNFHGQPLAMAADQMAIALATLAGICERRVDHMTNPHTSQLPAFLTPDPGFNSGFMIAQVTAAALASEMKALATPHSVDSIPTSGDQEDYVSMGMSAARRLRRMLDALCNVISIELLAAAQGIDFHAPLQTGTEARKAYELVRSVSRVVDKDRALSPDISAVSERIMRGEFQKLLR